MRSKLGKKEVDDMAQIFVSHSKKNEDLDFFHKGFSTSGVKGVFMEYEGIANPAWESIKNYVRKADSVFVLLSREVRDLEYTRNWVAFEVGLACQANKNVWVFEKVYEEIDFVVPYLTHYVLYDPSSSEHFQFIRNVIIDRGLPSDYGEPVVCGSCGTEYHLCTGVDEWTCPCCRQRLESNNS